MASRQQPGGGLLVVVVLLLVSALWAEAAVDCNTVKSDLVGCVGYLQSGTGNPTPQCCSGVKKLSSASTTTADRRKTCGCIKSIAAPYPNLKDPAVGNLPTLCGVKLSFRPSIHTDCNTIP